VPLRRRNGLPRAVAMATSLEYALRATAAAAGESAMSQRKKALQSLFRPLARAPRDRGERGADSATGGALEAIWQVVCAIPRGRASTYGAVARAAGLPGRARLTGFALRVAPRELNLPWHRVVGAGGRIVFPSASREHKEQAKRLRAEGVPVAAGRIARDALTDLEEP
jgi:methylated-DNA-protein-cysteine methyltransferase related protein